MGETFAQTNQSSPEREPIADVPNGLFLVCGLTVLLVLYFAVVPYENFREGESVVPAAIFTGWLCLQIVMIYGLLWFKRWAWPLALGVYSIYLLFLAYLGAVLFVFIFVFIVIYVFSQGHLYMSGW